MRSSIRLGLAAAILLFVAACAAPPAPMTTPRQPTEAARDSLAASELAFARHSVEQGMRAAFIEYFADDGINFAPDPGNTRARYRARPEAIEPFVLDWHPAIAAVARAGDLGFTTGPYTITGRAPAVRGAGAGHVLFGLAPPVGRQLARDRRRRRADPRAGARCGVRRRSAAAGIDREGHRRGRSKDLVRAGSAATVRRAGRGERLRGAAGRRRQTRHRPDSASAGPRRDRRPTGRNGSSSFDGKRSPPAYRAPTIWATATAACVFSARPKKRRATTSTSGCATAVDTGGSSPS